MEPPIASVTERPSKIARVFAAALELVRDPPGTVTELMHAAALLDAAAGAAPRAAPRVDFPVDELPPVCPTWYPRNYARARAWLVGASADEIREAVAMAVNKAMRAAGKGVSGTQDTDACLVIWGHTMTARSKPITWIAEVDGMLLVFKGLGRAEEHRQLQARSAVAEELLPDLFVPYRCVVTPVGTVTVCPALGSTPLLRWTVINKWPGRDHPFWKEFEAVNGVPPAPFSGYAARREVWDPDLPPADNVLARVALEARGAGEGPLRLRVLKSWLLLKCMGAGDVNLNNILVGGAIDYGENSTAGNADHGRVTLLKLIGGKAGATSKWNAFFKVGLEESAPDLLAMLRSWVGKGGPSFEGTLETLIAYMDRPDPDSPLI